MRTFDEDLKAALEYHGHLCAGQIIGVRMARVGLKMLEIADALAEKDLIVYVEADRCIADAVGVVTGCKLGRRRLKLMDYGKSAATFLHTGKNKAVRIASGKRFKPGENEDLVEFYNKIKDEELFNCAWVTVDIKPEDLPGKPTVSETCETCGEMVMDNRHVEKEGKKMCKSCAYGGYYKKV